MRGVLEFIHFAEKLKIEKRRGRTSDGNFEDVASHSWRVALLVMLYHGNLDKKISVEKALKMAIIHDIEEIITGDTPCSILDQAEDLKRKKEEEEKVAIETIAEMLPSPTSDEILNLWMEYESEVSYESKFVKALDKIEAQIQFNESSFEFWNEYDILNAPTRLNKSCSFDSFLKKIASLVQKESIAKIEENQLKNYS